jgi:hypothetical protein
MLVPNSKRRRCLAISLIVGCSLALFGCGRQKAKDRVLEAVNGQELTVTNGQAAVLRLGSMYAAIIPESGINDEVEYKVFANIDGDFAANSRLVREGTVHWDGAIDVQGVQVVLRHEGAASASVHLGFKDYQVGLGRGLTNDIRMLQGTNIEYKTGKPLNGDDLMKSIGK